MNAFIALILFAFSSLSYATTFACVPEKRFVDFVEMKAFLNTGLCDADAGLIHVIYESDTEEYMGAYKIAKYTTDDKRDYLGTVSSSRICITGIPIDTNPKSERYLRPPTVIRSAKDLQGIATQMCITLPGTGADNVAAIIAKGGSVAFLKELAEYTQIFAANATDVYPKASF